MNNTYGEKDNIFYCSEKGIYFYGNKKQEQYSSNYLFNCQNAVSFTQNFLRL